MYHNPQSEGLRMKHVDDSNKVSPIYGKNSQEILEYFKQYNFVDDHGHKLENCQDFIELINLIKS